MDCTLHGILQARNLEWLAFLFSRGSSQPSDWTQVSHTAGRVFTSWATREALSKFQQNHYIWVVCSANEWDVLKTAMSATSIGQQKGPNSPPWQQLMAHGTTSASKLNELGYEVLSHLPYSPDLSPTDYFFRHLDNLLQGKCFHKQHDIENAFEEFVEYRSTDFYDTGINKFIPCWQKCIDCNGSYFD